MRSLFFLYSCREMYSSFPAIFRQHSQHPKRNQSQQQQLIESIAVDFYATLTSACGIDVQLTNSFCVYMLFGLPNFTILQVIYQNWHNLNGNLWAFFEAVKLLISFSYIFIRFVFVGWFILLWIVMFWMCFR